MKPIATSTSDFADLIKHGGIYVDKAFKQIREKNCVVPYLASGLPIHLIGLSFAPETRQFVDVVAEEFE